MKQNIGMGVDRKPSRTSGITWKDVTIYILTVILCVQMVALLMWIPRCWRLNQQEESPYMIEETTIGGVLSARNIKNTLTGIIL